MALCTAEDKWYKQRRKIKYMCILLYSVSLQISIQTNLLHVNDNKQMDTDAYDLQETKRVGLSSYVLHVFLFLNHSSWHCHLFVFHHYKWQSFETGSSHSHLFSLTTVHNTTLIFNRTKTLLSFAVQNNWIMYYFYAVMRAVKSS